MEITKTLVVSILVLAVYACKNKEDEVSLPGYEDTIKLSTYLISVDNGGGEAYATAEYDRWVVDEKEPFIIDDREVKKDTLIANRVARKLFANGIVMAISGITGDWFDIKIEPKRISVNLSKNTSGKERKFYFWITDLRNCRCKVAIKQGK